IAVMKVGCDEFRNGVLIGHIERDMQVIITNCNNSPPTAGGINGTTGANQYVYNTNACSNFCFTIQTADPNASDSVYARLINQSMPGATITSSGGLRPLLTVCWAPTQADVGSHPFVIALRDNACPYYGSSSQGYTVNVAAASNPPVNAGRDTTLCPGQTTTLTATSTGSVTNYTWSDGTTTHAGATWANVNPAVTTIYTVTATYSNGCQLTDQVIVRRNPQPTITAFPPVSTICSTSDTVQITAISSHAASYQWSPPGGLTCTTCASPKISPTVSTTYTVIAYDSFGCVSPPFNVTVNLNAPPPTQSCSVIYATPNGVGTGTQASPANLATALGLAQCNNAIIKLDIGTYTIDYPITNIGSNTTLEGGFDRLNNWIKRSTPGATTIYRSALGMESNSASARLVAIYLNGAQYVRFQDLTIQTANCPATLPTDTFGASNYVIHMTNCSNYNFVRCQIIPGSASNGSVGVSAAGAGAAGHPGGSASGSARAGAPGGAGPNAGGNGGQGGNGGSLSGGSGTAGTAGTGTGAGTGGSGGGGGTFCPSVFIFGGGQGGVGTNGANGTLGTTGANGGPGSIAGGFFLDGNRGVDGNPGTNGAGGGGGGGCGAAGGNTDGSGGGGGGSGGIGGPGGTGGGSGGGCFGIFSNNNGANGVILQCNIGAVVIGTGGTGGTGGNGGAGGIGGSAGSGGSGCDNVGNGGNGGNGGQGGNGGSGANGLGARIYITSGTPLVTGDSLFSLVAQPTIFAANISCTNRDDTLSSASSGNWTAGAGSAPPSGIGTSLITQYSTTGRKDIGYSGNTYDGFVNIALDQSTFIPVIASSAPVLNTDTFWLCKGSTSNFNIQIASADTFQWNFGGATVPNTYYGSNVQNLSNLTFNTAGTFMILARIKTSCCGWSPYDTAYLLVEPNATINYTGPTSFCAGDSVHIILGGIATSYSWSPIAGVSNPTGSNVYIAPQVSTNYLATAYSPRGLCNADTSIFITKTLPATLAFTTVDATCGSNGSVMVTPTPLGSYTYLWNNASGANNGATISNQPVGTYTVIVTPTGSNCSVTGSAGISTGGGLQAFIIKTVMPKCFGQCNGQVKVKAIGGVGPYTYFWSPAAANIDSLINRCAGNYSVTITDANNCTSSTSVTLTQPAVLQAVVLDSVSPRCPGQCTGYAFADGQGGTGPYSFAWSNGSAAQKDTLLCPGHYTLGIVDQNGCTATTAVNIISALPMSIAFATINDSCFGKCDGSIKATVTNGQTPYVYHWSSTLANIDSIRNLCVGMYRLTVTDSFTCTKIDSQAITQPTQVTAAIGSQINDSCFGQCNGRLTAVGGGGTPGYSYLWSNAGTTGPLDSNLCINTYRVTVTDAMTCTATVSATITQPAVLNIVISSTRNDSCNGQCNGRIVTTTTGGTPPYAYAWTGGGTPGNNGVDSNLCVGHYIVTVTDVMGCTDTVSANITEPAPLVLSLVSVTNVSCFGGNNGQIVVSATGGTPAPVLLYAIDGPPIIPQASGTFSGLTAGMHVVGVGDSHLCIDTLHILITEPTQLVADTVSTTQVSCFGGNDGQIIIKVSGGTTPYTYVWPQVPGNIDSIADPLTANTYSAYVTDAKGCKDTVVATITQPAVLNATVITDSVTCFGLSDGKVFVTPTGGTAPYTYQLDGAGPFQVADSFTTLAAGPHSVIVTDAHNCTKTVNFTIYQPNVLTASVINKRNASCNGVCDGMIELGALGGTSPYSYSINGLVYYLVDSFSSLCAGTYNFTVLDVNGCSVTVIDSITQPTPVVLSLVSTTDPSCFGGSDGQIVVSAAGGTPIYLYAIDGPPIIPQASGTFNGLSAGLHVVGVGDSHGCLDTLHILLGQPAQLVADTISTTPVTCFGGSDGEIILSVTGGTYPYSYSWPQSPANIDSIGDNLTANVYTAIVTDAKGCKDTVVAEVTQPLQLTATVLVDSISCFGGSDGKVFITPAGGVGPYMYQLDASGTYQPEDSFINLSVGPHSVDVQDANLCTINIAFNVYQPTLLVASIAGTRDASCNGRCDGMVRASAAGGTPPYSYSIDGFTYFLVDSFNNVCAGTYTMTILDLKGCSATAPVTINEPTVLALLPVDSTQPSCFNGNNGAFTVVDTGGTPGYQYSIDGGTTYQASGNFTGQPPGPKTVTGKDANGCTATYIITVPNAPPNDTYSTVITNVTCNGGSDGTITASIVGGGTIPPYTYTWAYNNSHGTGLTGIPAGTYTVLITDGNGCIVYGPADSVVTQPTPITDTYTVQEVKCFGGNDGCFTVTPSGGTPPYTHSWSTGATTANPCGFAIGTYTDTIRDANGCIHIDNAIIMTQPTPVTATASPTAITCPGDSNGTISVTPGGGTPGYTYNWAPISSNAQNVAGLQLGTYTVTVTDVNLCTASATADILAVDPMILHPQVKNVLCTPLKNGFIYLPITGGTPAYNYVWSNNSTSNYLPALDNGTYDVTITDANGCEIDTSFIITTDSSFIIRVSPDTATINQGDAIALGVDVIGGGTLASITWDQDFGLTCYDCITPVATPLHTTEYVAHAVSDSGCISDSRSIITVIPQHQLYVPNTFTPNGDGINDEWEIFGNKKSWLFVQVAVFDRWGEKVFESNDVDFKWDGTFKGTLMEPNVYVYVLSVTFVDDYTTNNKGTVTVLR
ncbi:MAG: hypothetical protein JWO03_66, partial [Bacteroidetes bacterium]|nr:hypothetical protein [Bacteroidota bacterium]